MRDASHEAAFPLWVLALIAVLYYAGATLGTLSAAPEGVAIFWPPNALVVAVLIRFHGQRLLQIGSVAVAAAVLADLPTVSLTEALIFGLINFGEAVLAWRLLERLRFDPRFATVADVWKFLFAGPIAAALAASLLGAAVYTHFRGGTATYLELARLWWFADGLGLLILTPLLLAIRGEPLRFDWRDATVAMVTVLVAAGVWIGELPVFLLIIAVLYAAARFPPRWVAAVLVALTAFVVLAMTQGRAPFPALAAGEAVLMAQRFLFVAALLGLGFSALLSQLRRQHAELEGRVAERTRELSEANDKLARLATIDPLCGIGNRRLFDDVLARESARVQRYGGRLSLVFADIDHFKGINDRHGHAVGDQVLRTVAALLNRAARETDIVARYGGEEFAIILPHTSVEQARLFAERVRRAVAGQANGPAGQRLTASFGVAELKPGQGPSQLLAAADAALYQAKAAGRDRVSTSPDRRLITNAS